MLNVEIDFDKLQTIITAAVDKAIEQYAFKNDLPLLLTKQQFMEIAGIGPTKASELLNREDFPVIREFGHPKVLTHLFIQWCEEHTEWLRKNSSGSWKKLGGRSA